MAGAKNSFFSKLANFSPLSLLQPFYKREFVQQFLVNIILQKILYRF